MVFTIRAFVTFFTIIDPVGLAPVVIALTTNLNDAQRSIIVTRAVIISAIIIAFFALVGRFPLAIPMIAGPGTIATTILYVDLATPNIFDLLSVAAAIISSLFVAWLVMRSSMWIIRHVGRTGILVLSRILGILLAALAIQFILNGIGTFVQLNWPGK